MFKVFLGISTCGLGSLQWFAGCSVMEGNDFDSVLRPRAKACQHHAVLVTSGCWIYLSLALLWANVQDAV